MEHKKFKYKKYNNCSFVVSSYLQNKYSMAIQIISEDEGPICTCTVHMSDYMYYPGSATIKNYSENSGMTKFLQNLGIIEEIYSKSKCNIFAGNDETIDFCDINMDKLKEYSSEYEYSF